MKLGCVKEKNTKLIYDPRFTRSGIYTNDYEVENENSVLDFLRRQPSFSFYTDQVTNKKKWQVGSWNR